MKKLLTALVLFIVITSSSVCLAIDADGVWYPVFSNQLFMRVYNTHANEMVKSGYLTYAEIKNVGLELIYFKVTFFYIEGGSNSWDWNLAPGKSFEWSLDTRQIMTYEITER